MKRMIALSLVLCLMLSGCATFGERIKDPVTFHYLCSSYREDLCCVIVSEQRESSGHIGDLSYLLALYSMGPVSEDMTSPLPLGTRITASRQDGNILLQLNDACAGLSDIEFSLACACLTLTCLDITAAETVTITCGDRTKTMDRSALTLADAPAETISTEETK